MIVTALIARGVAPWVAKLVAYVGLPLLLLALVGLALDAWGDGRYRQGKADENAAWIAASDKLVKDAAAAASQADKEALTRAVDFAARQQQEKDKIDDALENGASPIDALFPSAGGDGVQAP